jgi:hypothetical protein
MATPDLDIANRLQAAGVGTVGTNIFTGGLRPKSSVVPAASIFVLPTGGTGPSPLLDGSGGQNYSEPTVQILVRGDVGTYITTRTKAQTALDGVHTSTVSGYFQVLARTPQPLYLGQDDTEHPLFSVNVQLYRLA